MYPAFKKIIYDKCVNNSNTYRSYRKNKPGSLRLNPGPSPWVCLSLLWPSQGIHTFHALWTALEAGQEKCKRFDTTKGKL
jgi:hypothetical protein